MKAVRRVSRQLFLGLAVSVCFLSCEKDEETIGQGNYIYAINNLTNASHVYNIYLDNEFKGKIIAESGMIAPANGLCDDMVYAKTHKNVIVIKDVTDGAHTLKIENATTLKMLHTENFTMTKDGCMCQPYTMM